MLCTGEQMAKSSVSLLFLWCLVLSWICLSYTYPSDAEGALPLGDDEDRIPEGSGEEPVASNPMLFHSRCGRNMRVSRNGKSAHRKNNRAFGESAVLTNRPLQPGEVFEVWVDSGAEHIEHPRIGVTTQNPEIIHYPDYMNHLREGTWGWDVWPDEIYMDGEVINDRYTVGERNIQRGDRFGVSVKDNELHFHHNGRDMGAAASDVVGDLYAYLDLYWQLSNATIVN
ncbi:hypothetical protein J437_LFUL013408 [Ladona fulva]|uniref:NHR domain-containing protein n=1 Tax=Ladona fulva TaxID=123851 RepID=A0A8K0KFS7_LADFU|nr:hypothetical protein J437_LFUL013408 [Ladona fulva]